MFLIVRIDSVNNIELVEKCTTRGDVVKYYDEKEKEPYSNNDNKFVVEADSIQDFVKKAI